MMKFTTVMLVGLLVVIMNQGAKATRSCTGYQGGTSTLCRNCDNVSGLGCCCDWGDDKVDCDGNSASKCCHCVCFPAMAKVQHSDGNMKTMAELLIGNTITTVNSNGDIVATEVIAFMKQQHNVHGVYAHITTAKGNEVVMSPDHLILSATPGNSQTFSARFAKEVQVGDYVKAVDGEAGVETSKVVDVKMSVLKGAYVPLTKEGTILVDGVLSSSYASIDHDVAHFFITPLRWFPGVLGAHPGSDGSHSYVDLVRDIGKWLVPGTLQSKQNRVWTYMAKTLHMGTASY